MIAVIGGELGGLIGFKIGTRWGTQLLDRPGKRQAGRRKLMEKGELAYAKWGRLAVFFTPAIISGTARMKFGQFALWNFLASLRVQCVCRRHGLRSGSSGNWSPLGERHHHPDSRFGDGRFLDSSDRTTTSPSQVAHNEDCGLTGPWLHSPSFS